MKRITFFFGLTLFWLAILPACAAEFGLAENSALLVKRTVNSSQDVDWRCLSLYHFLKGYQSPLASFSSDFIEAADFWGIDWKLLPAITGLESFFGRRMILGTYNAYGWGGGYIEFENWPGSINHVSRKIKENYYNRGLTTPTKIGPVYAPPNPNWGNLVASIMDKI